MSSSKCISQVPYAPSNTLHTSKSAPEDSQYGIRHVQCLLAFLGMAISFGLRVNLSVAIVAMTNKTKSGPDCPRLLWDESMQATILSSFYWGYQFLQIPGGQLAEIFGPKLLLAASSIVCGAVAILTPFVAIKGGFYWMIFARILQGLAQGIVFPATNVLLSKWTPLLERGRLLNFVYSGDRFGIFMTMALSGVLADSRWGWPSVFYVSGTIAILWALVFYYLGADSPRLHKTISESERDYILSSLVDTSFDRKAMKTPWRAIWTSKPVWALILTHCSYDWGYTIIITMMPLYIAAAFGSRGKEGGFLSAFPFVSSYAVGFIFAAVNDELSNRKKLSKTTARKLWNSIALWGGALGLCVLALAGKHEILALAALIASTTCSSVINLSLFSNHLDLSPNFAGTLMGITNGAGNIFGILALLFGGMIINDYKSIAQWQLMYLTAATVFFVGNLIFIVFGTAEVQPWNDPSSKKEISVTS